MSPAHFSSSCNAELGNPATVKVRKVSTTPRHTTLFGANLGARYVGHF